jgi:DNA-binding NtrC family response regulator
MDGMLDALMLFMNSLANTGRFTAREATSLVVTRDIGLVELVRRTWPFPWLVENHDDWHRIGATVRSHNVRVIIFDDDAVPEENRSELIENIHNCFPDVLIIYIAGKHSQAVERSARASGILSYTSKPVEAERLEHLLKSLSHRLTEPSGASGVFRSIR